MPTPRRPGKTLRLSCRTCLNRQRPGRPDKAKPGGGSWPSSAVPSGGGRSRLRGHAIAVSVLAAPDIDLCNADIEGSELVLYAFSLLGGPDIYVADSMRVEMSGFSSLVGNDQEGSQRPADPDAPVIWIRSYSLIGGCTVWRLPPHLQALPYRAARKLTARSIKGIPS
jgi:hypothetical protein